MATKLQIPTTIKDSTTRRFIEELLAIIISLQEDIAKLKANSTS